MLHRALLQLSNAASTDGGIAYITFTKYAANLFRNLFAALHLAIKNSNFCARLGKRRAVPSPNQMRRPLQVQLAFNIHDFFSVSLSESPINSFSKNQRKDEARQGQQGMPAIKSK